MENSNIRTWAVACLACALLACQGSPEAPVADGTPTTPADPAPTAGVPWPDVPRPTLPTDRHLQVGFLVVEGVYNTELTAPYDIFHHTRFRGEPHMEVFTVSPDGGPITTFEGLKLTPDYGFDDAPPIDVLVVPSGEHNMGSDLEDETLIEWVRTTGEQALFIVSLCDGAFVLAEAGLLDTAVSTTFPGDQDAFAERYPHIDLRRGVSFVHHGKALTSEGGARSFDVSMYLVHHLYGETWARDVGRGMVIDWPPTPGSVAAGALEALVVEP